MGAQHIRLKQISLLKVDSRSLFQIERQTEIKIALLYFEQICNVIYDRFCSGTCVISSPFSTASRKLSKTKISISFCVS